jgi:Arc/MetJ-type ribon-helix-helix transcriptional regulator
MKTISLKLPDALDAELTALAERTRRSKSEVAREALRSYFSNGRHKRPRSAYDLSKDLAGSIRGPQDLSTNKKHMRGYGR